MATAPAPSLDDSSPVASPSDPSHVFPDLIQRLLLYRSPSFHDGEDEDEDEGDGDGDDEDVAEPGTVFSSVGLAEPVVPRPDRFMPKRAAVLICLFDDGRGDLRVILTKRSSNLSSHSGEVAFPGGKTEEGDADDVATATREANEEIGLDPSLVTVVAILEPFLSRHLLRVVPVIGFLSDKQAFRPAPNAAEVEAIFDAPLDMFLKDENRRFEEREWMGEKYLIHYFDYETDDKKFVIWGLTASILIRAASVIYQQPPSFPEQKPRFKYPRSINGRIEGRVY